MSVRTEIIIDTNVVLDCFVFGNPGCGKLLRALETGEVQAVGTAAMRDELAHVLGRGLGERWPADAAAVITAWNRHVQVLPEPPVSRLWCTDTDDQKFIDLALARQVPWLVTRDRALLRLAPRALAQGVAVLTPEGWTGRR